MSQNEEYRYVSAARAKHKKKRKPRVGRILFALLLVVGILAGAVTVTWRLLSQKFTETYIKQDQAGNLVETIVNTPDEYQGDVVNVLVAGIANDENDMDGDYTGGLGLTDIIMYVTFNVKENYINVFQIPRDSYIGAASSTGKINAVYAQGPYKDNPISNLAEVVNKQFQLPIDYYATVDVKAFTEIIDLMSGIDMYLPYNVYDEAGNSVPQGEHHIDGATARWILRQRHCYPNGDIGRMETQMHFYAACFRLFKSCTITDLTKHVLPVVAYRVNTDIDFDTLTSLAVSLLKLDGSRITFVRPAGGGMMINEQSVVVLNPQRVADLLNQYFRPYGEAVPASALQLPTGYTPAGEYEESVVNLITIMN